MTRQALVLAILISMLALPAAAQQTPPSFVAAYDSLADTILSLRSAEQNLVKAVLDIHLHAANARMAEKDWQRASAEMALFANEGDNAVGGVRKRLLEGGHHFNAAGEEQGIYEPGFVVVTREAKKQILEASSALRQATTDEARQKAWDDFAKSAKDLLAEKM